MPSTPENVSYYFFQITPGPMVSSKHYTHHEVSRIGSFTLQVSPTGEIAPRWSQCEAKANSFDLH